MATRSQLESALRNAANAGDDSSAKQLANALKQGAYDASPDQDPGTEPDRPFFQSPDFAGVSFFDDRLGELRKEQKELTRTAPSIFTKIKSGIADPSTLLESSPNMNRQIEVNQEIGALNEQKQTFLSGKPESVASLPELKAQPSQGFGKASGAMLAGILAPEEKDRVPLLQKFGWEVEMESGFPVIINPETKERFQINAPGLSERDFLNFAATALQFAPAAKATGLVAKTGSKAIVGGVASAATEAVKQTAEKAFGGDFDLSEVGLAGLLGGASEFALPALKGIWNKLSVSGREKLLAAKSVSDIKKLGIASAEELNEIQKLVDKSKTAQAGLESSTGVKVPLFRGQATGLPSDQLAQRYLAQLDPTSRKAMEKLRGQNEKAYSATISLLNEIAPEATIETAGKTIRNASQAVVEARRLVQKQASSPIYKQAFRRQRQGKVALLDMSKFSKKYSEMAKRRDFADTGVVDDVSATLKGFVRRVKAANGDLEKLHGIKMWIDDQLLKRGDDALGNTSKFFMRKAQKDLVNQLTKHSPSYRAAKSEFIRTQGPIDELMDMSVGKVSKITDDKLDTATKEFFSKSATPGSIKNARKAIEAQPGGKDAWRQMVRRELQNRIGGIQAKVEDQGSESITNLAGELRSKIFGNPEQRRVLMQALDGESKKNFLYLESVLSDAASGRAAGSPTSLFEKLKSTLYGPIKSIKLAVTSPLDTAANIGDETIFNRNARAMADVFYDERWLERMSKIKAMGNTPKAGRELSKLIEEASKASVQATRAIESKPDDTE